MGLFSKIFGGKKKESCDCTNGLDAKIEVAKEAKPMGLNLSKRVADSTEKLGLCLAKNGMNGIKARVQVAMDESGSMEWENLYSGGFVQRTFERLMPLGLKFDDNKSIECYTFNTSYREHDEINLGNLEGYVKDTIARIEGGGTKYSPVIRAMVDRHIETQKETNDGLPTFILFMTDGENRDHEETRRELIRASKENIFFMFIGMGKEKFTFLQELDDMEGREKDNADFEPIVDISELTDEKLYSIFLREFKDFVKLGK